MARKPALVLSGGGVTGFLYEIGALTALDDVLADTFRTTDFSLYAGTSAGAAAAALLANGARPADIFAAIYEGRAHPLNVDPRDVFGLALPGVLPLLRQFVGPLAGALARALRSRRLPRLTEMLADLQEHHPPGFYSTAPLQPALCRRFTQLGFCHEFAGLQRELYITGADIDTAERLVFGAGPFRDVRICRAVAASCAIPIFFRPLRIEGRDVVDGAVAEITPVDVAIEHGADLVFYVNPLVPLYNDRRQLCLPRAGGHCARLSDKGVAWIGEQALRMLLSVKHGEHLETLRARHPGIDFFCVQPRRDEVPMFMHNMMSFAARRELLDYGYRSASKYLKGAGTSLVRALRTCVHPHVIGCETQRPHPVTVGRVAGRKQ